MPTSVFLKKWDDSTNPTNNFDIVTKLQDFGSSYSKKTIIGIIINMIEANRNANYLLRLWYRSSENGNWTFLNTIQALITSGVASSSTQHRIIFPSPIKGADNFQFRLTGRIEGDIGINDMSVIYRQTRNITESELSE